MDDELLKLECLKLAHSEGLRGSAATEAAGRYFNHLKGRSADSSPHGATPQARVVGKDGNLEPPFKDYVKD